jgi:hypothetical protein
LFFQSVQLVCFKMVFCVVKLLITAVWWLGFGLVGERWVEVGEWAMRVPDCIALFIAFCCLQRNSVIQNFMKHIRIQIGYLCRNLPGVGQNRIFHAECAYPKKGMGGTAFICGFAHRPKQRILLLLGVGRSWVRVRGVFGC